MNDPWAKNMMTERTHVPRHPCLIRRESAGFASNLERFQVFPLSHPPRVIVTYCICTCICVCLCICNCIGLYLKLYLSLYLYLYLCSAVFQEFTPNVYSDILELFTSVNHLSKTGICSLKVSNI